MEYLHMNCYICDIHFEERYFMNASRKKTVWNAVPSFFNESAGAAARKPPKQRISVKSDEQQNLQSYTPVRLHEDHHYHQTGTSAAKAITCATDPKLIAAKVVQLQAELGQMKSQSEKKAVLSIDEVVQGAVQIGMKPAAAKFFEGQLKNCSRKEKGHRWTVHDKGVALGIFYRSRQAYATLSNIFTLPSASTLNRFVAGIPLLPGLQNNILKLLSHKVEAMSMISRHCVITFDEMSLRKEISYNAKKDEVDGLVQFIEKEATPCNQALVFMVRGLTVNWKQPLSYYFSENAAPGRVLETLLYKVLEGVCSIGLQPVAVVCDQGACNRNLYSTLGVHINKPFFMFQDRKIYAVHDVPHILKNIRNTLKKNDIKFDDGKIFEDLLRVGNKQIASWKHVEVLFKIDSQLPVRLAPKLTTKHVYLPPFSPMRVNFAAQVCSHSVYAAIHTLVKLGKMEAAAASTADFLKQVNNIFDLLNVRAVRGGHCPPLKGECDYPKISRCREQVEQWRVKGKARQQPCFEALIQSLNATQMLCTDLVVNGDFRLLLTGRINQDCLENFFSQIRAKGGHRFNPSSKEFGFAYRSLAANMLLKPIPSANCVKDQDDILLSLSNLGQSVKQTCGTKRKLENTCQVGKSSKILRVDKENNEGALITSISDFQLPSIQSNVVSYIAGYLLRKVKMETKCNECMEKITERSNVVSEANLFCHYKVYKQTEETAFGSLYAPAPCLQDFIQRAESLFQKHITTLLTTVGLLSKLLQIVLEHVPLQLLPLCSKHCNGKYPESLLHLYLRCRLHYYFRFESRKLAQKISKANRKGSVLKHV